MKKGKAKESWKAKLYYSFSLFYYRIKFVLTDTDTRRLLLRWRALRWTDSYWTDPDCDWWDFGSPSFPPHVHLYPTDGRKDGRQTMKLSIWSEM